MKFAYIYIYIYITPKLKVFLVKEVSERINQFGAKWGDDDDDDEEDDGGDNKNWKIDR